MSKTTSLNTAAEPSQSAISTAHVAPSTSERVAPLASVTADQTSWSSRTRLLQCSYSEQTLSPFFIPLSSSSWWMCIPIKLSDFQTHAQFLVFCWRFDWDLGLAWRILDRVVIVTRMARHASLMSGFVLMFGWEAFIVFEADKLQSSPMADMIRSQLYIK